MKKYILIAVCWLFMWCIPSLSAQQAGEDDLSKIISKVELPKLTYLQRVRGLTFISPNKSKKKLTRVVKDGKTILAFTNPPKSGYNLNQMWWVVQDFGHRGFTLVSASYNDEATTVNKNQNNSDSIKEKRWLFLNENGQLNLGVLKDVEELKEGGYKYFSKKYFFEFIHLSGFSKDNKKPNQVSIRAITHSLINSDKYTDDYNTLLVHNKDTIASKKITTVTDFRKVDGSTQNKFLFTYEKIAFNADDTYIPLPMSDSKYHTRSGLNFNYITVKKKDENNRPIVLVDNQKYLASGIITAFNGGSGSLDDKMFKIRFDNTNEKPVAEVGIMGPEYINYPINIIQQEGSRKPIVGLRTRWNKIYAFTTNTNGYGEELKGFNIDEPLYFGFKNDASGGVFVVSQGDIVRKFTGIPTHYIFGIENPKPTRLLVGVEQGKVGLAYRGEAIGVSNTKFGDPSSKLPEYHNTDPLFSFNPPSKKLEAENLNDVVIYNKPFDWMQKIYKLRYNTANGVVEKRVYSPFFDPDKDFSAISAKEKEVPLSTDLTSAVYSGGEDFYSNAGWELLAVDFGYDENQLPKDEVDVRAAPYMVLYNRTLGKLRLFVYASNYATSNRLKATLKVKNEIGKATEIVPFLWRSSTISKALDDPSIFSAPFAQSAKLSGLNGGNGKFVYFDFLLNSDPCSCISNHELQIHINKVSSGKITLVGRSMGSVIPGSQLKEFGLENPADFLASVLENPYETTESTLGDISIRNYDKFKNTEWPRRVNGVLKGRKIEDWEKEEARLKYQGTEKMSDGDELSADGKAVKAAGEAMAGIGSVISAVGGEAAGPYAAVAITAATILKVAGEAADSEGTRVKGKGRGMVAKALKMRYDNIKNKDRTADQSLSFTLPKPQPSIVFSELAAKGKISITTRAANTIRIALPGSKLATTAKFKPSPNRGVKPIYNEPLGIVSMLHKPKVAVNFKDLDDNYSAAASITFKEWPYITTNVHSKGNIGMAGFVLRTKLTVYALRKGDSTATTCGLPIGSMYNKGYILMSKGVNLKDIPLNIQSFLKRYKSKEYTKQYILDRIKQGFIELNVELVHVGVGQKNSTDTFDVNKTVNIFESYINIRKAKGKLIPNTKENNEYVFYDGVNKKEETFSSISPALVENWGKEEIAFVNEDLPNYKSKVLAYCQNRHKNTSVASRKVSTSKEEKNKVITKQTKVNSTKQRVVDVVTASSNSDILIEELDVYPNPSNRVFTIGYKAKAVGEINMEVTDMAGRVILTHKDTATSVNEQKQATINLQSLVGVYILKVQFANGETLETKLIKK